MHLPDTVGPACPTTVHHEHRTKKAVHHNTAEREQGGVGAPAQREAASGGGPRGIVFRGGRGCGQTLQKRNAQPIRRV